MTQNTGQKQSVIPQLIVPILVGLILSAGFHYWRLEKTKEKHSYNNTPAGLMELSIELKAMDSKSKPQATTPTTEVVPVFNCSTIETRDAGFRSEATQALDKPSTSYRIPRGCVSITLTGGAVRTLSRMQVTTGSYLFRRSDASSQTGYVGCGTMEGVNDPPAKCLNFLRENRGRVIEVLNDSEEIKLD